MCLQLPSQCYSLFDSFYFFIFIDGWFDYLVDGIPYLNGNKGPFGLSLILLKLKIL